MEQYDLQWFIASAFGAQFAPIEATIDPMYQALLLLATEELENVRCYCPAIYETALSIKLAIMVEEFGSMGGDSNAPTPNNTDKVAVVIEDQVYDTKRKYALVDRVEEVAKSSPAGVLASILERCRPKLKVGARTIRSHIGQCTPCSGGFPFLADKSDG